MSALLQTYEVEFTELSAAVKKDLFQLRNSVKEGESTLGSADRATLLKTIQHSITKLKELNTNIQYEAAELPPAKKEEAKKNLNDYKSAVMQYEKELTRAKTEVAAKEREELLAGAKGDTAPLTGGAENDVDRARIKMEENTRKMRKGTDTLRDAERLVNEADEMADQTIVNLGEQREKIQKIRDTTRDAHDEMDKSRYTLNRMQKVMIQNKALLIIIICVLIFLIAVICYMKFSGGKSNGNGGIGGEASGNGDNTGTRAPRPTGSGTGCEPYCVGEPSASLNLDGVDTTPVPPTPTPTPASRRQRAGKWYKA